MRLLNLRPILLCAATMLSALCQNRIALAGHWEFQYHQCSGSSDATWNDRTPYNNGEPNPGAWHFNWGSQNNGRYVWWEYPGDQAVGHGANAYLKGIPESDAGTAIVSGTVQARLKWVRDGEQDQSKPPLMVLVEERWIIHAEGPRGSALSTSFSLGGTQTIQEPYEGDPTERRSQTRIGRAYTPVANPGTPENPAFEIDVPIRTVFSKSRIENYRYPGWNAEEGLWDNIDRSVGAGAAYSVNVVPVNYAVSTDPSGACAPGECGTTGNYPGRLFWNGAVIGPESKDFYAVVKATVTLPSDYTPDAALAVNADRVRYVNNVVTPTGASGAIVLVLITSPNDTEGGAPQIDAQTGQTTWTYRTHDLSDQEDNRIQGSNDWKVSDKKGRWRLRVASPYASGGYSDPTEFKIDKRSQIVGYASDWASWFEDNKNLGTNGPGGAFNLCFSFASHVYGKTGLSLASGDGTAAYGAATAPDGGNGSLRFFWTNMNPPSGVADPGHVGIISGPNARIDNNGSPADAENFNGPTLRGLDDGVGTAYLDGNAGPRAPKSQTLPAERGGIQADGSLKSILHELDEE